MNDEIKEPTATEYWGDITRRKRGRKRLGDKKKVPMTLRASPWTFEAIKWIMDQEEARTGKRPTESKTVRGLLQMGVDVYRKMMRLPEVER